jgi:hypothetical protein
MEPTPPVNRRGTAIAVTLAAIALAWFVYRGPLTALAGQHDDLSGPYGMSRAWLMREAPYQPANVLRAASDASGGQVWLVTMPVYPPTTLVMMAPFAALPWKAATILWHVTLVSAYLLSAMAVMRWMKLDTHLIPAAMFGAAVLAFAPAHTGFILANPGVPSAALAIIATWLALEPGRQRAVLAGVLLGLAVGLKPQVALPFWVYLLATRRWTAVGIGSAVPFLVLVGVVWDLTHVNPHWFSEWRSLIEAIEVPWVAGNTIRRFGRLQLAVIVEFFLSDRPLIRLVVAGLLVVPAVVWLRQVWTRAPQWRATGNLTAEAVAITPGITMSLLAMYHRPYDAVALLPTLGWVVWDLTQRSRAASRAALVAGASLLVFLVLPWVTVLVRLAQTGVIPQTASGHAVFQLLVMAHPTWALVTITAAALWQLQHADTTTDRPPL